MQKKIAFHNLGCKVNSYEIEYVQQRFVENDFEVVPFDQKADIFIINTCTVTNIADRKTRQMLHRARKLNDEAVIVAMGCYAETNKEAAMQDECIDILIGNNDKGRAFEIISEYLSAHCNDSSATLEPEKNPWIYDGMLPDIASVKEYDDFTLTSTTEHTRVYIKIQDGCNQFCSYCAIPLARGRVRSRKPESIIDEITDLTHKGYKEFVLTGIHLSSYGSDFSKNSTTDLQAEGSNDVSDDIVSTSRLADIRLIDIIEAVANIDGVKRIRLGSLEPRIITDDFLKRLSCINKICPHFHLSLQSGSDSVLKRMNRHYTTDEYYEKVKLIRDYFDHPAITTDVIAGFPGETDEEFKETQDFLNKCNFYEAHIFKYSRRKGTVADRLSGQLTEKEKAARSNILIKDTELRSKTFREYYTGKDVDVLFEEIITLDGVQYLTGFTGEYVKVIYESSDKSLLNTIQMCHITGLYDNILLKGTLAHA